ncbi:MAG: outer membrane lipoprotein carrier protein LolA, partial [Polyangiaceae bacterium]|nr:outer membrane lipoprotein carrier protein LolA [Polyangiaceae bacterium]
VAPGHLARLVEEPVPSHVILSEGELVSISEGERRAIDLKDKPSLQALVSSLLHLLAGNRQKLEKSYKVVFQSSGRKWSVELLPKSPELKKMVLSLKMSGQGEVLQELQVREASGDVATTRFSDIEKNRRFTLEEKKRLFELYSP